MAGPRPRNQCRAPCQQKTNWIAVEQVRARTIKIRWPVGIKCDAAQTCREGEMHAVIFEVEPNPERRQDYLDFAARLRPELEQIDGFIAIERFESLTTPGKILSLSFWRDEAAVARWRRQEQHRAA